MRSQPSWGRRATSGHPRRAARAPRRVQTAEGELTIAMSQVRGTPERLVSQVIPDTRAVVRTRRLETLVLRVPTYAAARTATSRAWRGKPGSGSSRAAW